MHEKGITQDIIQKIIEAANIKGIKKVAEAKVSVGETLLTHPEEVKEIFKMLTKGTILNDSKFILEIEKVGAKCSKCQQDFNGETVLLSCSNCGSPNIDITAGNQIKVIEIK